MKDTIIFTPRQLKLMTIMDEKGFVTRDDCKFYCNLEYYLNIWKLRKRQLIQNDGTLANNKTKRWKLTPKGKEVMLLVLKLSNLLWGD